MAYTPQSNRGSRSRTPLREKTTANSADLRSFGDYDTGAHTGDVLLQATERVVSQERLVDHAVERPINVPAERIVEKVVEKPKIVEKNTVTEQPVIQQVEKVVYVTREVPVENIIEKQVVRKVVVERIVEQVREVIKEVPVERIVEQVVEVVKEVPIEKVVERIQIKEIPVVETEERVVEVVREVPVEIVKEVPVYVKVDAAEWDARHGLTHKSRAQYGGVGMLLGKFEGNHDRAGNIYVLELVPGTPAEQCHLISLQDILISVEGEVVHGMHLSTVHQKVRGPEGTPVVLEFVRGSSGERYTVTLYRMAAVSEGNAVYQHSNNVKNIRVVSAGFSPTTTRGTYDFYSQGEPNGSGYMANEQKERAYL